MLKMADFIFFRFNIHNLLSSYAQVTHKLWITFLTSTISMKRRIYLKKSNYLLDFVMGIWI